MSSSEPFVLLPGAARLFAHRATFRKAPEAGASSLLERVIGIPERTSKLARRSLWAAALVLAVFPASFAATPAPLNTLSALHNLTNADASKSLPVSFPATVTYFSADRGNLFVQDGSIGIHVTGADAASLSPGDRVRVTGFMAPGYRPYVSAQSIALLGHSPLPTPVSASFDQLITGKFDSVRVTVRGVVRGANPEILVGASRTSGSALRIMTDGGYVDAIVNNGSAEQMASLLDDQVAVTGVAGGTFDGKHELTGIKLHVPEFSDLKILKPAAASAWSLPETPIDQIMGGFHINDRSSRLRVSGVATYYEPGSALVLQNGTRSLWVSTRSFAPVKIGDRAEATGFPAIINGVLALAAADIKDSGNAGQIAPQSVTAQQLNLGQHVFDLVSIEGTVAVSAHETGQDEYVLSSGSEDFPAVLRFQSNASPAPASGMKEIPAGSRVRVTGICVPDNSNPFRRDNHFSILLRSADDIAVVASPPWLNAGNLTMMAGFLLIVALLFGVRAWLLESKTRREIGSLAYVEQRRGRILESINSSEPLAEILERVTELVSVRLNGAPCWCQVTDGAAIGNRPAQFDSASLRIAKMPISARVGPPLGNIFAAFDARTKPARIEREALGMAVELATLAIETSRLYTDLVRRSEFDMLTDVQNRFAMERTLNAMIHNARQSASIFGVIFIDLNEFKQVNDVHGHMVGDLYLQEVAQRMKRQLRPGDTLARIGGDEFAVLVPEVRSREEAEEISARLEACFAEPFIGDAFTLYGSASIGIALYPDDATSAEDLLTTADSAMYAAKFTRAKSERTPEAQQEDQCAAEDRY
jgi:diguanylate cyclase (GGDEF)-like protein